MLFQVDESTAEMKDNAKTMERNIKELEDIASKAKVLRNQATFLGNKLEMFESTYLQTEWSDDSDSVYRLTSLDSSSYLTKIFIPSQLNIWNLHNTHEIYLSCHGNMHVKGRFMKLTFQKNIILFCIFYL